MQSLLDFLFPKKCVGCRKSVGYFCQSCIYEIKQTDLVCPRCERLSLGGVVHPGCIRRYGLDGLWSLGIFAPPLRTAIHKLKYRWIKEVADVLVNITLDYWAKYQPLLLDKIKKDHGQNWLIVPVPLHKSRENWRGFNQSALLAKAIATKTGLKYENALIRTKKTKPQVTLKSQDRKLNIKNAFEINKKVNIKDQKVILVDDVWTTGSTLKECCYILKRAGIKQVWALTLAR